MKTASVTELKNGLSAWLKTVESGESVLITDRRKPVAVLRPLEGDQVEDRMESMVSRGLIAPPQRLLDASELEELPLPQGPSLSAAILEDREDR